MGVQPKPRNDGEERPQDVTVLWEQHHEILRLLTLGWRPKQIADHLGCCISHISSLRNSPIAQDQLALLNLARDEKAMVTTKIISEAQPRAARFLAEVIDGHIESSTALKIKTCQDMLSRGGNSPIQRSIGEIKHGLTQETLDSLKQRRDDAKAEIAADGSGVYAEVEDAEFIVEGETG